VQYKDFFLLLFITLVNQNLQMLRWVGVTSTPYGSHVEDVSGCCKICGVSQRGSQLALSLLQGLGVACLLRNTATSRTIHLILLVCAACGFEVGSKHTEALPPDRPFVGL